MSLPFRVRASTPGRHPLSWVLTLATGLTLSVAGACILAGVSSVHRGSEPGANLAIARANDLEPVIVRVSLDEDGPRFLVGGRAFRSDAEAADHSRALVRPGVRASIRWDDQALARDALAIARRLIVAGFSEVTLDVVPKH